MNRGWKDRDCAKQTMQKIRSLRFPAWTVPLALLGVAVLAYGIFIPWFRLYGDDWSYLWNYHLF